MCSFLIINADDCNLTAGVSRGILKAVRAGVVTSTTVLMNQPLTPALRALRACTNVGIGLHLNTTLGKPVARLENVSSLVDGRGFFRRFSRDVVAAYAPCDMLYEYKAQFKRFYQFFGHAPTHLDTHHHTHRYRNVYDCVKELAVRYKVPMRRRYFSDNVLASGYDAVPTTDYIRARLNVKNCWTERRLISALSSVKPGITELVVHPGYSDHTLRAVSSFADEREQELNALISPAVNTLIKNRHITLVSFHQVSKTKSWM